MSKILPFPYIYSITLRHKTHLTNAAIPIIHNLLLTIFIENGLATKGPVVLKHTRSILASNEVLMFRQRHICFVSFEHSLTRIYRNLIRPFSLSLMYFIQFKLFCSGRSADPGPKPSSPVTATSLFCLA